MTSHYCLKCYIYIFGKPITKIKIMTQGSSVSEQVCRLGCNLNYWASIPGNANTVSLFSAFCPMCAESKEDRA